MKLIKIIFFIVLFNLALTVTAQTPITQGSIQVSSSPYTHPSQSISTVLGFTNNLVVRFNDQTSGTALPFFSNRTVTGFTYTIQPASTTRGDILQNGSGCVNLFFTHPNVPLSTRLDFSLADFRVPKFPKSSTQNSAEIIVPFTMTGRVSCVSGSGDFILTILVTGAGNARLRFTRVDSNWKRVYLTYTNYEFGTSSPSVE